MSAQLERVEEALFQLDRLAMEDGTLENERSYKIAVLALDELREVVSDV